MTDARYIEIPYQGCTLALSRDEYKAAVKRGRAFRRAKHQRERLAQARERNGQDWQPPI